MQAYSSNLEVQKSLTWNRARAQSKLLLSGPVVTCGGTVQETAEDLVHELSFDMAVKFDSVLTFSESAANGFIKGVYALEKNGAVYDRVGGGLAPSVLSHHVAYFSYHAVALTF